MRFLQHLISQLKFFSYLPHPTCRLPLHISQMTTAARALAQRALALNSANAHGARRAAVRNAVESFRRKPADTGSPEVQIALLSARIAHLTEHLKTHRKDKASTRAVVALVQKRRSQMQYLLRKKPDVYKQVVQRLELRPSTVFSKDVPLGAKKRPAPRISFDTTN